MLCCNLHMEQKGFALVTGASSGIGRELALLLSQRGYNLVLTARSEARLEELRTAILEQHGSTGRIVHPVVVDLSLPDGPDRLAARLAELAIEIELLVNNAGTGSFGPFADGDPDDYSSMIAVNVTSLTRLTRLLLPGMVSRHSGRILNVASVASFQPGPLMAVYYATKAYVLSFSEALSEELAESGVTVTALCPGPTATEFHARAGIRQNGRLQSTTMSTSRAVAESGIRALLSGRRVVVTGALYRLLTFSVRLLPRRMVARAVLRMQRSRTSDS